ncbi:hypothetical protein [Arthrobacter methylotrophus]
MIARAVRDFPEPDSPTSPKDSPALIENVTSCTRVFDPWRLFK